MTAVDHNLGPPDNRPTTSASGEPSRTRTATRLLISRRRLLGMGAGAGGLLVAGRADALGLGDLLGPILGPILGPTSSPPPASILVVRAEDGLFLTLSFANLDVRRPLLGAPQLALRDPAKPGFIMLGFPPQSLFEQAVYDDGTAPVVPPAPFPAEVSGPSRVAVLVAPGSPPFNYDLPTLLGLSAFPLSVSDIAERGSGSGLPSGPPSLTETAIEAPWRLVLSPGRQATFSAQIGPVTRAGRTELWHARAARRQVDGKPDQAPGPVNIRAVWSPDVALTGCGSSTAAVAMTPQQRAKLVAATTTSTTLLGDAAPADASLLLVSPMGASLDVRGAWPTRNDVLFWRHRSWLGRDNYVKIDEPGFLFPFGFPAVKVSITERVLGSGLAFLRKREFIVVREPTINYPVRNLANVSVQPNDGRNLPFQSATTTTLVSPPLIKDRDPIGAGEWVQVPRLGGGKEDLRYRLVLTGQDGAPLTADLPLIWVPATTFCGPVVGSPAYSKTDMDLIVRLYGEASPARRTLALAGQKLAFVPRAQTTPAGPPPEDPAVPTFDMVLLGETSAATTFLAERKLNGFPMMDTAQVRIEAIDAVGPGTQPPTTRIRLYPAYTASGFGGATNRGEIWAKLEPPPPDVKVPRLVVPQQAGGGLAAPELNVAGLSRAFGPAQDLDKLAMGEFRPEKYFDLDVNLLGGISLQKVIATGNGITAGNGDQVPKVVTTRTGRAVDTVITWRPALQKALNGLFTPGAGDDARLELKAVFHTDLENPGNATQVVTGDLRNFTLKFVGESAPLFFISQKITRLHFESRNGGSPSVDVQLGASKFEGDLRFLAELQSYLPALPGGIKIDVSPRGVAAGLSIAIPTVGLGVLTLQNLAIGVRLDLPFNGEQATLTFNFATREHPFNLTVSLFGGGGFLAIGMGTRGVQVIEGAIEFGAAVAIDLGVASGSVSIMAGIYFKFAEHRDAAGVPDGGNTVVITGYVRAVGELEILGLITVSLEFYLGLTFSKDPTEKKVEGDASLTVRVEVALFSTSVSVSMHKEFSGGTDPTFGDQLTVGDWSSYCAAFAA